jgi:hypothetical protein
MPNDPGSGYDPQGNFVGTPPGAPMEGVEANPMIDPTAIAAGSFGNMIRGTKAETLVNAVRASRLARIANTGAHAAQEVAPDVTSSTAPTFGDAIADAAGSGATWVTPDEQAAALGLNASGESAASQEAISRAATEKAKAQVRFLVDTRSGHYKPLIGGVDAVDAQPGPHEILVQMGVNKDPSVPTILAQGKNVTSARIARLANPKNGIMPKLHPEYKGPLAKVLGGASDAGGAIGTAEETPAGVAPPMPGGAGEVNPSTPGNLTPRGGYIHQRASGEVDDVRRFANDAGNQLELRKRLSTPAMLKARRTVH